MQQMTADAVTIAQRCNAVAATRDGMRTAIVSKARETEGEVSNFMKTYLEDAEALDGLEFLGMAEVGAALRPLATPRGAFWLDGRWFVRAALRCDRARYRSVSARTHPCILRPAAGSPGCRNLRFARAWRMGDSGGRPGSRAFSASWVLT